MKKIPYAELAVFNGEDFIENCYWRLLHRQVDPTGRAHFLSRLEAGEDKALIVGALLRSQEGRRGGEQVSGLWARYWLKRLKRWPVIGLFIPTPPGEVRQTLRAIDNQLHRLLETVDTPEINQLAASRTQPVPGNAPSPQPEPQAPFQPQPAAAPTPAAAAAPGRPCLFLLVDPAAGPDAGSSHLGRLASALVAMDETIRLVRWDAESGNFHLVGRDDLQRLGLTAGLGESVSAHPETGETPILVAPTSCGAEDWLLVPDAVRAVPDAQSLTAMNLILEAKRLGLRSAFVFHGAGPLRAKEHAGRDADELYMQALLLADAVVPVSAAAADELAAFFAQHQLADAGPLMTTIPLPAEVQEGGAGRWTDCARRIRRLLTEAADPSRHLAAIYYWVEADPSAGENDPAGALRLASALAGRGIALVPVAWNAAGRHLACAEARPDGVAWAAWIEPGMAGAPRWVLCPDSVRGEALAALTAFARSRGLRVACLLRESAGGIARDTALFEALAGVDKVLAVSPRRFEEFQRFLLSWRGKAHSAEHRFKLLVPAGRGEREWDDHARNIAVELATDRLTDGLHRIEAPAGVDVYAALPGLRRRPKLSLCISTYNRGGWVEVNLRNIFTQVATPRDDLEVLVVDNASSDDTPTRVRPWLGRRDFRFIRNPKNVGMLGNLAVTAQRARGDYVWILGDDDLTRPGTIERVLEAVGRHPGLALVYLNYGYSTEADPGKVTDLPSYLAHYNVLEPAGPDEFGPVKRIAAKSENFFTAIYSHVYRRDHALKAYCQNTSGRIFSTMLTCVPTAYYVLNCMAEAPAFWIGEPALVVNSNVSWQDYGVLLDLEQLPRTWDLAERMGADPAEVDRRRANRLWLVEMMWKQIFENDKAGNSAYFSAPRVLMRLKHLKEFDARVPEFRAVYERARAAGHPAATLPADELFAAFGSPAKS